MKDASDLDRPDAARCGACGCYGATDLGDGCLCNDCRAKASACCAGDESLT
jgi:hypothetical protein